jgi:putative transposase
MRYVSIRGDQAALRMKIREIAAIHVDYGYRRITVRLRRDGWLVSKNRVQRLYGLEKLGLRRRKPRRRVACRVREGRQDINATNECWAMDFLHDEVATGHSMRVLAVVDIHTRQCIALEAAWRFTGSDVAGILSEQMIVFGKPMAIRCDNGTEFTSQSMDLWAYQNGVVLDFSRPGKPTDNAFIESFNARFRAECLNQHWFTSLEDAQQAITAWRDYYNSIRPHSALGNLAPGVFAAITSQRRHAERAEEIIS